MMVYRDFLDDVEDDVSIHLWLTKHKMAASMQLPARLQLFAKSSYIARSFRQVYGVVYWFNGNIPRAV